MMILARLTMGGLGAKSGSTKDLQEQNYNTEWMGFRGSWIIFVLAIFGVRYLIEILTGMENAPAWGVVHFLHCTISFWAMHWMKGTPLDSTWSVVSSQGRFDKLTWWEQLDNGQGWSDNKKFLALLVVFTFIMALRPVELKENALHATAHTLVFFLGIVPKFPNLHGVRLFGMNED